MELGTYGATRQSWQRDSVRVAWAELKREHPRATFVTLIKLFADRLADENELRRAAAEYIGHNCEQALDGYEKHQPRPLPTAVVTPQQKLKEQELVTKAVNQILLLNQEMPNGKRLRYCTGTEVLAFGEGYRRIGKKCGSKLVGAVLNEDEAQKLMQ